MKNCPKCNSKLANYQGASICSGLNQTNGNHATIIQGQSCLICGTWIEEGFKVVCPMPGKWSQPERVINFVRAESTKQRSENIMSAVQSHFETIKQLRDCGASWKTINKVTKITGSEVVIKRSYLKILRGAA